MSARKPLDAGGKGTRATMLSERNGKPAIVPAPKSDHGKWMGKRNGVYK